MLTGIAPGLIRTPRAHALARHGEQTQPHRHTGGGLDHIQRVDHGLRGNGGGAQRGNGGLHQQLAQLEQAVLDAGGNGHLADDLHERAVRPDGAVIAHGDGQLGVSLADHQKQGGKHPAHQRGKSRAHGAQAEAEDQQGVAADVDAVGQRGDDHGQARIAPRPELGGAGLGQGEEGIAEGGDKEIVLRLGHDRVLHLAEDELQQPGAEYKAHGAQHNGQPQRHQIDLLRRPDGVLTILPSQVLGADDGAAGRQGADKVEHQRVDGIHAGDGRNGRIAHPGHHNGVHHAHQAGQQLLKDQWDQQPPEITIGKQGKRSFRERNFSLPILQRPAARRRKTRAK